MEEGDKEGQMNKILQIALDANHPGIDEAGMRSMKAFVAEGRFTHEHYINMWSARQVPTGHCATRSAPPSSFSVPLCRCL